jgi:two-component sensor histidine kinase
MLGSDLSTYLTSLCAKIAASTGVDVCFDGETVVVPVPVAQGIAQILTEVAINVGKHNPRHRSNGLLQVDCRCENETLRLVLRDAVVQARPANLAQSSGGIGLSIVASTVKDLDGRVDVTWDNGIVFELTVPLA